MGKTMRLFHSFIVFQRRIRNRLFSHPDHGGVIVRDGAMEKYFSHPHAYFCLQLLSLLQTKQQRQQQQYVNRSATAVRGALKEPAKRKAMENGAYSYKYSVYEASQQGPKTLVASPPLS
jgi:Mitochondrial ATP synthase epsilon chain